MPVFPNCHLHVKQHKPPFHVDDLIEDLQDGTKLLALLEVLSGKRLVRCNPWLSRSVLII